MEPPLSMDRVGIDGLNGPGPSRSSRLGRSRHKTNEKPLSAKHVRHVQSLQQKGHDIMFDRVFGNDSSSSSHDHHHDDDAMLNAAESIAKRRLLHNSKNYHNDDSHKVSPLQTQEQQEQQQSSLLHASSFTTTSLTSQFIYRQGIVALLKDQGFSTGLAMALNTNVTMFDRRIWIVDNSGSMEVKDGHRIVVTSDRKTVEQSVTRWEELHDTVMYHSEMAALLQSPTMFKLLNHPGPGFERQDFSIASKSSSKRGNHENSNEDDDDLRAARVFMQRVKPLGTTPLTRHLWNLQKSIHAMAPKLRREGRRVVVVVATDGLPTDADGFIGDDVDAEFMMALKSLEGLPIWLVIRLCTDEDKVTQFYNDLDGQLNLNLEVLDDFMSEAREVRRHNKWLNYCMPLHRCRELGYHHRVFDYIDERTLTKEELKEFCALIFGTSLDQIPNPETEWKPFVQYIQERLKSEDTPYDPLKKRKGPWIYINVLHRAYGRGKCTVM